MTPTFLQVTGIDGVSFINTGTIQKAICLKLRRAICIEKGLRITGARFWF